MLHLIYFIPILLKEVHLSLYVWAMIREIHRVMNSENLEEEGPCQVLTLYFYILNDVIRQKNININTFKNIYYEILKLFYFGFRTWHPPNKTKYRKTIA